MYTWNQRTGFLDTLSANVGLELVGTVLKPLVSAKNGAMDFWERYLDLVGVREENERLKADLISIQSQLIQAGEDRAELRRLRSLLSLPGDRTWRPVGARVVAGRMGPNSALETVMISRGYLTGGAPGTPLMTNQGLVGRVLRASAHNATALLLTDPGSRIAVLSQDTRTPGILTGRGARHALEVRFVARNAVIREGELLVTSGLDGVYPKGLPVARIVSVEPSDYSQFMSVRATPLVEVEHLEEVLLLEPTGLPPLPEAPDPETFVGPPAPSGMSGSPDSPASSGPSGSSSSSGSPSGPAASSGSPSSSGQPAAASGAAGAAQGPQLAPAQGQGRQGTTSTPRGRTATGSAPAGQNGQNVQAGQPVQRTQPIQP